ncbi:MAG: DUF4337 family protein [Verrucomicrobiota bacterium]|jgi:hypothetical protein
MIQASDLDELKALVAELRADHVAQKEKERRERWTRYVSLFMVVVAVLSAVANLKGGGFSTRNLKEMNDATFNQTQASDQWAFYQASSIKGNLCEIELEHLSAAPAPDAAAVAQMKAKVDKYDKNKAESSALAKKFEAAREAARKRADAAAQNSKEMGLAITLFQVAIALGAMCLIVKKKPLWFVSMILAAVAAGQMAHVLFITSQ